MLPLFYRKNSDSFSAKKSNLNINSNKNRNINLIQTNLDLKKKLSKQQKTNEPETNQLGKIKNSAQVNPIYTPLNSDFIIKPPTINSVDSPNLTNLTRDPELLIQSDTASYNYDFVNFKGLSVERCLDHSFVDSDQYTTLADEHTFFDDSNLLRRFVHGSLKNLCKIPKNVNR